MYPTSQSAAHFSRYLLCVEALESIRTADTFLTFERCFKEFGIPDAIRSDNGVPFANVRSIYGLSSLSVWWLRLGINLERIKPGKPQENGRHERMHRTLKEWINPVSENLLQQQERFDEFIKEFNSERPHEALNMQVPSDVYERPKRVYPKELEPLDYPGAFRTLKVGKGGDIFFNRNERVFIGRALANENLGVYEEEDEIYSVRFMNHLLGYMDFENLKLSTVDNPFDLQKV